MRIEDIDPPREVPGSAQRILADLARLGMEADGDVLYQSTRMAEYDATAQSLIDQGAAYWCGCSRSDLPESGVYPGTCRNGLPPGRKPRAIRFRTSNAPIVLEDQIQGEMSERLEESTGDFVIRRADGLPAYQLAVVVDDAFQKITHIVRGADLLESTFRQIALQTRLGLPTPRYAHVPVVADASNAKLSKRDRADPITRLSPPSALRRALEFLGQAPPATDGLTELWGWALEQWRLDLVPRQPKLRGLGGTADAVDGYNDRELN